MKTLFFVLLACWTGSACTASSAVPVVGGACDVGGAIYTGCDGAVHNDAIVRWTLADGDVVTCWMGQAVTEPAALSCAPGTTCTVILGSDGSTHQGTCR